MTRSARRIVPSTTTPTTRPLCLGEALDVTDRDGRARRRRPPPAAALARRSLDGTAPRRPPSTAPGAGISNGSAPRSSHASQASGHSASSRSRTCGRNPWACSNCITPAAPPRSVRRRAGVAVDGDDPVPAAGERRAERQARPVPPPR